MCCILAHKQKAIQKSMVQSNTVKSGFQSMLGCYAKRE